MRRLAEMHLERIAAVDQVGPSLRSVIELNPDWEEIADRLDGELREGRVRTYVMGGAATTLEMGEAVARALPRD